MRRQCKKCKTSGKGFTLIELLVVISIIALLLTMLLPSLGRARDMANMAVCGSNMNTLGKGMALYKADNEQSCPNMASANTAVTPITWTYPTIGDMTGAAPSYGSDLDPWWKAQYHSNIQAYWLLYYAGTLGESAFKCPADVKKDKPDHTGTNKFGFGSFYQVSYAFQPSSHDPGTSTSAGNVGYPGAPGQDDGTFIAGDKPNKSAAGTGFVTNNFSLNHPKDGPNLLTAGGSVKAPKQKNNCTGLISNNIYIQDCTVDGNGNPSLTAAAQSAAAPTEYPIVVPTAWPAWCSDSVLLWPASAL